MKKVKAKKRIMFKDSPWYSVCENCNYKELQGKNKNCPKCNTPFMSGTKLQGIEVTIDGEINDDYSLT